MYFWKPQVFFEKNQPFFVKKHEKPVEMQKNGLKNSLTWTCDLRATQEIGYAHAFLSSLLHYG